MAINDPLARALGLPPFREPEDMKYNIDYEKYIEICKEEAIIRNSEIITCDKCGVRGNRPNMMRWHFEQCKTVFRYCEQCGNIIPRQGIKDSLYKTKKYCKQTCYFESKKGRPPIIMTDEVKEKLRVHALADSETRSIRAKKTRFWENSSRNSNGKNENNKRK